MNLTREILQIQHQTALIVQYTKELVLELKQLEDEATVREAERICNGPASR